MSKFVNEVGDIAHPKFAEVVIKGTFVTSSGITKKSYNVFNMRRKLNSLTATEAHLGTIFNTTMMTSILAAMNTRYSPNGVDVRFMDDPTSLQVFTAAAGSGEQEEDSYDSASAVYMLLRTGYRGRSFFGSKHFTPLNEDDTTIDELTGAGLTRWQAVQTAIAALASGITDSDGNVWNLCIVSRELSNLTASPAVFTGADVTSVLLNKTVGTMRHRKEPTVR